MTLLSFSVRRNSAPHAESQCKTRPDAHDAAIHAVKQETPDALLLFRLGDFYELFFDDAVTASRELEITLTARNKDRDNPVPMCGVPYHAADGTSLDSAQRIQGRHLRPDGSGAKGCETRQA